MILSTQCTKKLDLSEFLLLPNDFAAPWNDKIPWSREFFCALSGSQMPTIKPVEIVWKRGDDVEDLNISMGQYLK